MVDFIDDTCLQHLASIQRTRLFLRMADDYDPVHWTWRDLPTAKCSSDTITPNVHVAVGCSSRYNGKSRVPSPNGEAGIQEYHSTTILISSPTAHLPITHSVTIHSHFISLYISFYLFYFLQDSRDGRRGTAYKLLIK